MRGVGSSDEKGHEIKFKFLDSLRFMTESLDKLASLLSPEKKTNIEI